MTEHSFSKKDAQSKKTSSEQTTPLALRLWTDAISPQGYFDPRYTCDFDNSSPELRWDHAPPETQSFALLCEDLDTGPPTFVHWIVTHIPDGIHHLPAGIPPQEVLPNGIRQGLNSYGRLGYAGPCPPQGSRAHQYRFRLFALSEHLPHLSRITRDTLLELISPICLTQAELEGRYQRALPHRAAS
jgi:Raf kinase inhibitor-like YbhB/YbcL family protein